MINFIKTNIYSNNELEIKKLINNDSIIITSLNKVNYYKKSIKNIKVDIYDLNGFIYKIIKKYHHKKNIIDDEQQKLLFLKVIIELNDQLQYINQYQIELIDDLIEIYNNEFKFKLIKTDNKTEIIKETELIIEKYLDLLKENNYIDKVSCYQVVSNYLFNYQTIDFFITDLFLLNEMEKEVIIAILKNCNNAYMFIYNDKIINNLELLKTSYQSIYQQIDKFEVLNLDNKIDEKKDYLIHNLFKSEYKSLKTNDIFIYAGSDLYDEISFIANQITKNIKLYGYKYSDFAIISPKIEKYENYFNLIFNNNNINYTYDLKLNHHFLLFIDYILEICENNFDITTKIDKLIDFLFSNIDKKNLEYKQIKNDIIEIFKLLKRSNTFDEFLKNIYVLILKYEIDDDNWQAVISIMENINFIFKNDMINIKFIRKLFSYLSKNKKIKNRYLNQVLIGNLNDLVAFNPQVVFLIGVNTGNMTPLRYNNIILPFNKLSKYYFNYPITLNNLIYNFQLFYNLTCFQSKLYLSYYKVDNNALKVEKSEIIDKFLNMFENIVVYNKHNLKEFSYLPNLFYDNIGFKKELKNNHKLKEIFAIKFKNYEININKLNDFYHLKKIDLKLQDNKLFLSPSKIDIYNNCHFHYYCKYILRLKENNNIIYDQRLVGIYVHFLLENNIRNFKNLDYEKKFRDLYQIFLNKNDINDQRSKFLLKKLTDNIIYLWPIMVKELINNQFSPFLTETNTNDSNFQSLIYNIDSFKIIISGIIDRIDVSNKYFRIIDYKTNNKKIDFNEFLIGINLQLFIYLLFVDNNLSDKKFGALFYQKSLIEFNKNQDLSDYKLDGLIYEDEDLFLDLGGNLLAEYTNIFSRGQIKKTALLNDEKLNLIKRYTEKIILNTSKNIIAGQIDINPIKELKVCNYCPYIAICGIEAQSKLYRKMNRQNYEEIMKSLAGEIDELD